MGDPLTDEPSGPVTFDASLPLSPTTTSNSTSSPSPTLLTAFLGLFREIAVLWTKTSSFVSFLLMKPYPDLTLNHLTVPQTLVATTSLGSSSDETASLPSVCVAGSSWLESLAALVFSAGAAADATATELFSGSLMMVRWSAWRPRFPPSCSL